MIITQYEMNLTNYQDKVSLKLHIEGSRLISKKKEKNTKRLQVYCATLLGQID